MSQTNPDRRLGARLRELRAQRSLTQRQVSEVLDISSALISSWESGSAVPPEERLSAYARLFARRQLPGSGAPAEELTAGEEELRQDLVDELVRLREEVVGGALAADQQTGALGGRFWYFPDGQPITILCTPLSQRQLGWSEDAAERGALTPAVEYATNRSHPNAVPGLGNGDVDTLVELVGHIRAENPTAQVRWLTNDRVTNPVEQLTGHVVLLGGTEEERATPVGGVSVVGEFFRSLEVPVKLKWADDDVEFGGSFVVWLDSEGRPTADAARYARGEEYAPRFVRDENAPGRPRLITRAAPQITSDVAQLVRAPNPVNPSATLTALAGIFSRGTYGAVRAFTDAQFRTRNEQWLLNTVDSTDFWLLFQVPVFADSTMTPDLTLPRIRLRSSA